LALLDYIYPLFLLKSLILRLSQVFLVTRNLKFSTRY
jgi:hypothetical protein